MSHSEFNTLVDSVLPDTSAEDILFAGLRGVIAAEISMKRQQMGMSQKELASCMGVTQGLVSRWERGETNFTLATLVKISAKLGLDLQSPIKVTSPKVPYTSSGKLVYLSARTGSKWSAQSYHESEDYTEWKEM